MARPSALLCALLLSSACNASLEVAADAAEGGDIVHKFSELGGKPYKVKVGLKLFTAIFSVRCEDGDHINIREARAVLHYVRWVLRSRARHCRRMVLLVDSKVVVGALGKGESGSRSLNYVLRQIHVLCLPEGCVFL